jgi:hypothetical protein
MQLKLGNSYLDNEPENGHNGDLEQTLAWMSGSWPLMKEKNLVLKWMLAFHKALSYSNEYIP